MTEHEQWGYTNLPTDNDINRQFKNRPESMFEEQQYKELKHFWKQLTALGDPLQYSKIGRTTHENQDYAETVALYFPGGRQEIYHVNNRETVDIALIDEENNQHGFQTIKKDYKDLSQFMQEIIEHDDNLTWTKWG